MYIFFSKKYAIIKYVSCGYIEQMEGTMGQKFIKSMTLFTLFIAVVVFFSGTLFFAGVLVYVTVTSDIDNKLFIIIYCFFFGPIIYYGALRFLIFLIWYFENRKAKKHCGYMPKYKRESAKKFAMKIDVEKQDNVRISPAVFIVTFGSIFLVALSVWEFLINAESFFAAAAGVLLTFCGLGLILAISILYVNTKLIYGGPPIKSFYLLFEEDIAADTPPERADKDIKTLMARLAQVKADITDEEMTVKISKIEFLIKEIYDNKDAHPSNSASIRKFTSYYMPAMISLLSTYASLGNNIVRFTEEEKMKESIKKAMQNIYLGFEKLAQNMFENTEMCVAAEIDALNSILAADGLLVKDNIEMDG